MSRRLARCSTARPRGSGPKALRGRRCVSCVSSSMTRRRRGHPRRCRRTTSRARRRTGWTRSSRT
eukprot:4284933-Alexandrium_andersonii.AAC.1